MLRQFRHRAEDSSRQEQEEALPRVPAGPQEDAQLAPHTRSLGVIIYSKRCWNAEGARVGLLEGNAMSECHLRGLTGGTLRPPGPLPAHIPENGSRDSARLCPLPRGSRWPGGGGSEGPEWVPWVPSSRRCDQVPLPAATVDLGNATPSTVSQTRKD